MWHHLPDSILLSWVSAYCLIQRVARQHGEDSGSVSGFKSAFGCFGGSFTCFDGKGNRDITFLDFIAYLSDPKEPISKWDDLKNLLSEKGNSAVANYVFFKYVQRSGISVQDSGVVDAKSENKADINKVIIPAWNDMVEMNHEVYDFLKSKQAYDGFCFDGSMLKKINWFGV